MGDGADLLHLARASSHRALDRVDHLAALAEGHGEARLAPDMDGLDQQLRFTVSFARRTVMGLVGQVGGDLPLLPVADLAARARQEIDGIDAPLVKRVRHRAGEAELDQSPQDYLLCFALPNLWFHLTMAYAILRASGKEIGKADFDGLHVYGAPQPSKG